MPSENQALRRKEKIITWLIAIAVASAVFVSFIVVIKKQVGVPTKATPDTKMLLSVKYWLFYEGHTTPVVAIKNLQNITREDCKITINDSYIREMDEIPSTDNNPDLIVMNISEFVRDDGKILDLTLSPMKSACVICNGPVYNSYCGDFSRLK